MLEGEKRVRTVDISALELNKIGTKKTSFKGIERSLDKLKQTEYKFYAPPYDKDKFELVMQFAVLKTDEETGQFKADNLGEEGPHILEKSADEFRKNGMMVMTSGELFGKDNPKDYVGYRYVLIDKEKFALYRKELAKLAEKEKQDKNKKASADVINENRKKRFEIEDNLRYFIVTNKGAGVIQDPGLKTYYDANKGTTVEDAFTVLSRKVGPDPIVGSVKHGFVDAYANPKDFRRNHFNKAGGTLNDVVKHIDDLKPNKYFMSNPQMGRDTVSSHMYWGENFLAMPDKGAFKNLVQELFLQGKQYIADGAITSHSIQSPFFQHALKYGEESPYIHWFKINGRPRLGVIPDNINAAEDPMKHIGFKIINPINTEGYNPNKPSYIQFYDNRLASEEQIKNDKLIRSYDIKNPKDPYEISTHQDSILPYHFELDYTDKSVVQRFGGYKNKLLSDPVGPKNGTGTIADNLETFFSFKNYDITRKGQSSGVDFWDGNVDIAKMNLTRPNIKAGNVNGSKQVREYLFSGAEYWSNFTKSAMVECTARLYDEFDMAEELGMNKNEKFAEILKVAKAHDISNETLDKIHGMATDGASYSTEYGQMLGAKVQDETKKFRPESLLLPDNIVAVLSSPRAKEVIKGPQFQKMYNQVMTQVMSETFEGSVENVYFGENGKEVGALTKYGERMADYVAPAVFSFVVIKSLYPDAKITMNAQTREIKMQNISDEEASIYNLGVLHDSFDTEVGQLTRIMRKNLSNIYPESVSELSKMFKETGIQFISAEALEFGELFVEESKAGLNWRFDAAKDIADMTAVKNGVQSFEEAWDDVIDFWGKFMDKVRDVNPYSYAIAEVTDLWSFYINNNNYESAARGSLSGIFEKIDKMEKEDLHILMDKLGVTFNEGMSFEEKQEKARKAVAQKLSAEIRKKEWGEYAGCNEYNPPIQAGPRVAERALMEKARATAPTDYDTMFNFFPNLFGENPESGDPAWYYEQHRPMEGFKQEYEKFLESADVASVMHRHVFWGNHDKPRVAHTFAVDTSAFLSGFKDGVRGNDRAKEAAQRILGGYEPINYDSLSSKGVMVADAILKAHDSLPSKDQLKGEDLVAFRRALAGLAVGKSNGHNTPDFLRSEAFGQNPLEITIKDLVDETARVAQKSSDINTKTFENEKFRHDLEVKLHKTVMEPVYEKMIRMSDVLNNLTSKPFTYAGDEYAQTGYEYACKNITQANRNPIHFDWIDPKSKDYREYVHKYHDRVQAGADIANKPGLSAVLGGTPIPMAQSDRDNLYGIFKYDSKGSNVIQLFSSVGMNYNHLKPLDKDKKVELDGIELPKRQAKVSNFNNEGTYGEIDKDISVISARISGEQCPFKRLVYDERKREFVDEVDKNGKPVEYVVDEGSLKLVRADGKKIVIDDTLTTFYRDVSDKKNKMSDTAIKARFFSR